MEPKTDHPPRWKQNVNINKVSFAAVLSANLIKGNKLAFKPVIQKFQI